MTEGGGQIKMAGGVCVGGVRSKGAICCLLKPQHTGKTCVTLEIKKVQGEDGDRRDEEVDEKR